MNASTLKVANFAGEKGYSNFREIGRFNNERYFLVWNDDENTEHDFFVKIHVLSDSKIELVEDTDGKIKKNLFAYGHGETFLKLNANAAKENVVIDKSRSSSLTDVGMIILILSIIGCAAILFTSVFTEVGEGYYKQTVFNGVAFGEAVGCLLSGVAIWALFKEIAQISFTLKDIYGKMK